MTKPSTTEYRKLLAVIGNVEDALDRKLRVEKAMLAICLRYPSANLRNVVKCLLDGDYPIVEGTELHHELARGLGVALENYDDEGARKEDVRDLIAKWSRAARKKALKQKPVRIPKR